MSSDRTDRFRNNLLGLPCTICEGHDGPEHLVHVELAQREGCGRRSCNIGPAGPVERLPLIGNRRFIYSVGIAYSRDIDRQTLILRRRSADDRQPDWWLIHREILIPESEDLNIPERIDAIGDDVRARIGIDIVGYRHVSNGDGAIVIEDDIVVRHIVIENGDISARLTAFQVLDFTYDVQLVRLHLTGEEEFEQRLAGPRPDIGVTGHLCCGEHMLQCRHCRNFVLWRVFLTVAGDSDPDVEPRIAVEKIVAAVALENITPTTTKQNIAGVEGNDLLELLCCCTDGRSFDQISEQLTQAVDAVYASLSQLVIEEDILIGGNRVTLVYFVIVTVVTNRVYRHAVIADQCVVSLPTG